MLELEPQDRIMVALDCGRDEALEMSRVLEGHARWVKVGMTLYYACGPEIVHELHNRGFKVFLDLKLHDIPHQVRGAAEAASLAGADVLTVHALGSSAMIKAACEGVDTAALQRESRTQVVAVTVLTSMDQRALSEMGIQLPVAEEVAGLAGVARFAGADGLVCSPLEAQTIRRLVGEDALIITPGVRPAGADIGDQSRVATPRSAIEAGASHIVVGRPITQAEDPVVAFDAIAAELLEC